MENQIKINLEQTKPLKCKNDLGFVNGGQCNGEVFSQVFFIRIVPALLSPTMREEIVPVPAFRCVKCNFVAELTQK